VVPSRMDTYAPLAKGIVLGLMLATAATGLWFILQR
jgi:hypothetical protein